MNLLGGGRISKFMIDFCDLIFVIMKDGDSLEDLQTILGLDNEKCNDFVLDFMKRTIFIVRNSNLDENE